MVILALPRRTVVLRLAFVETLVLDAQQIVGTIGMHDARLAFALLVFLRRQSTVLQLLRIGAYARHAELTADAVVVRAALIATASIGPAQHRLGALAMQSATRLVFELTHRALRASTDAAFSQGAIAAVATCLMAPLVDAHELAVAVGVERAGLAELRKRAVGCFACSEAEDHHGDPTAHAAHATSVIGSIAIRGAEFCRESRLLGRLGAGLMGG